MDDRKFLPRIVLTGAPSSGKTRCIERLKRHERLRGFVFFDELARQLLEENPAYRNDWHEFHREIYRRQRAREEAAAEKPFITDRGTADAFAFCPDTAASFGTTRETEYARYTAVIHLGASARLGDEYHESDPVRPESAATALQIDRAIADVWRAHPGYHFIASTPDFERKYASVEALLMELVDEKQRID